MDKGEFAVIRRELGKTQRQMVQLLGTSEKAVKSIIRVILSPYEGGICHVFKNSDGSL